ncbi:hypothetical protein GH714_043669 [Hevea brasiliensis]|uniref:O-methyltransferase C-terminal domain-containing protein n=1 Tax=Hevea brasiliensis TaxID=3981 RepID=A0A6A6K432_HEVBR|nr:hypothetical protein GH714_043669 [Hevea brasiliensis]
MVMETKQKEDHESNETELLFDLLMMVLYNSQERNEKEWAQLFSDAGFGLWQDNGTLWEYAGHEPNLNNFFNEAMASDARLVIRVLINECKGAFEELKSLVDVGGGTGTVAKAIAKAFPQLDCVVFDLPHVVAGLQGTDNLKYIGGNMFEEIPPSDAFLLKVRLTLFSVYHSL